MIDSAIEPVLPASAELVAPAGSEHCIARREDGVLAAPRMPGTALAAVDGKLQRAAGYEEFGEVQEQEQRIVEGEGVTVHADVYGHVVSRGGPILLHRNLVGGSARNARGPIVILGGPPAP